MVDRRVVFQINGWPISVEPAVDLAAPSLTPQFSQTTVENALGERIVTTHVGVQVGSAPPAGAVWLRARVGDSVEIKVRAARVAAAEGFLEMGNIPNVLVDTVRKIKLAWLNSDGLPGAESEWTSVTQRPPNIPEDPGEELEALTPPYLILDPVNPMAVGTIVTVVPGTFSGGVAPFTVNTNLLQAEDQVGTGLTLSDTLSGEPLEVGQVGLYLSAVTEVTDAEMNSISIYAEATALPVYDPTPATEPVINDLRWVEVATDEWLPIFDLDPMDPGDYEGYNTGNLRVQWARKPTNGAEPQFEMMSPYDFSEGQEATLAGTSGEWRTNTLTTDTVGNWIRPNRRMPEHRPPDKYLFLIRYSNDGGVTWSPSAEYDPDLHDGWPWSTIPDPVTGARWRSLERTPTGYAQAPTFYGEGHQIFICMSGGTAHSRAYLFGDMCHIRRSNDFGDTWYPIKADGLTQFCYTSGAVDPIDPDRVLAAGNSAWFSSTPPYSTSRGIWLSTNGGTSWSHVLSLPLTVPGQQTRLFTYTPASLAGASSARVWYFMRFDNSVTTVCQLYKSTNGGTSWSTVGATLNTSQFGRASHLQHHPVTANKLYLAAENGLWQTTNEGASWTRVGTGLPNNKCRNVCISPDGATMYVGMYNGATPGVWKSTNSGSTWSRVFSAQPVVDVAVDWNASPHVVYVKTTNAVTTVDFYVSTNGGSSFSANVPRTPQLGYAGDAYYSRLGGNDLGGGLLVGPNAGTLINHNVSRIWKTTNSGASFRDSSMGHTGINTLLDNKTIWVDPNTPSRFAFGAEDLGFVDVLNWGKGIAHSNVTFTQLETALGKADRRTARAACILPSGRMILAIGTDAQAVFYKDPGQSGWTQASGGWPAYVGFFGYHPSAPTVVGGGPYKSTNSGASWASFGQGMRMCEMSADGTGWFVNGDRTVYRSTNWHTSTPTFTPFYQATTSIYAPGMLWPCIEPDPFSNTRLYTRDGNKDVCRVSNTGGTFGTASILSLPLRSTTGIPAGTSWAIGAIGADSLVEGLIYATHFLAGTDNIYRGQITGSSISWTNITGEFGSWPQLSLDVHPTTGDVMIGGGVGVWMYPPPDGHPATESIWDNLPDPVVELLP